MTLQSLEESLKSPDALKRANALREFKQSEFGIEAIPVLEKAMEDEILVVLEAIECIGKLGPKALVGESADLNTPRGVVAKLFSIGNRVWSYSGYKNCYSTSLQTLLKLGYTPRFLLEYIRENIDLGNPGDFVDSLTALKAIGSPEALELLQRSAASRLPELNKAYSKKVLAILAKAGLPIEQPKTPAGGWYPFHTLEIKAGQLWAGDPQLPNADDGLTVNVPAGKYVVECDGEPHRCKAVSKLRVRLQEADDIKRGKKLGQTGTDSATIGVCEIDAFETAYKKKGGGDAVQKAIDSQAEGFGVITVPEFPGLIMPFVPTGSDGEGPVFALMSGKKCVGIELVFASE